MCDSTIPTLTQRENQINLNLEMRGIKIHVFIGGQTSLQSTCFIGAVNELMWKRNLYDVVTVTTKNLRENDWTEAMLVDWLLAGDIHIIACHPHQGTNGFNWDVTVLYAELARLDGHIGFPRGAQCKCPIFSQDKYEYLSAVPSYTNPTLKIPLTESIPPDLVETIDR
jgi:hypothetical protein